MADPSRRGRSGKRQARGAGAARSLNGRRAKPRREVSISGYGAKLQDPERKGRYLGDRVSGRAFVKLLKKRCKECDLKIPGGLSEGAADLLLDEGDDDQERTVRAAAVEFGERLADIVRSFLAWSYWRGTERIVIGGGMAARHVGSIAIHAAQAKLMKWRPQLRLVRIQHHPNEAGLVGSVHLIAPAETEGKDGLLAVDIGGSKVRAGIVEFGARRDGLLADARVWLVEVWKHSDTPKPSRERIVRHTARMLEKLIGEAGEAGFRLAPLVRVGLPGEIDKDGFILSGAQNLPGEWETREFNFAAELGERLPLIGGRRPSVSVHNDAVVQGLAEFPFMQDVARWGILTIGSGLGNAHFVNR